MMQNFIVIGSPGSGKGTFCEIMKRKGFHNIALGEILRREVKIQSDLGRKIEDNVNNGKLISDDLAFTIISKEMDLVLKLGKQFVIEGFPSTMKQYHLFVDLTKQCHLLKKVTWIHLDCPKQKALERIVSRLTCQKCSKIYNLSFLPPKDEGICDLCGGTLFHRNEDSLSCGQKRIQTFESKTQPIVGLAKENFSCMHIDTGRPLNICLEAFTCLL